MKKLDYNPGSLRYWQARYERHIYAVRGYKAARRYSLALENFLSRFQDRKTPDEISIFDVKDYEATRKAEGRSSRTIALEIDTVRAFYNWLTDIQDVPTFNPAKKFKRRVSQLA